MNSFSKEAQLQSNTDIVSQQKELAMSTNRYIEIMDIVSHYFKDSDDPANHHNSTNNATETFQGYFRAIGIETDTINKFEILYSKTKSSTLYEYLLEKGINELEIKLSGIDHNTCQALSVERIIYPLKSSDGLLLGFLAHAIDASQKNQNIIIGNSAFAETGSFFYGLYHAKEDIVENNSIICLPSVEDVLKAHQYGYKNAITLMPNTSNRANFISEKTKQFLFKYSKNIHTYAFTIDNYSLISIPKHSFTRKELSTVDNLSFVSACYKNDIEYQIIRPNDLDIENSYHLLVLLQGLYTIPVNIIQEMISSVYYENNIAIIVANIDYARSTQVNSLLPTENFDHILTSEIIKDITLKYTKIETSNISIIGAETAGASALRLAFKNPDVYKTVVALAPTLYPALTYSEIPTDHITKIMNPLAYLGINMQGNKDYHWTKNNPTYISKINHERINNNKLNIYIDCSEKSLFSKDGCIFLNKIMEQGNIQHIYHEEVASNHDSSYFISSWKRGLRYIANLL